MLMISEKQVMKQWVQYYLNFIRKKDGKINIKIVITSGKLAFGGMF